jgi:hypothetical protein
MGDASTTYLTRSALRAADCGFSSASLASVLARMLAPMVIKKEKKIQTARLASAEVAVLRKTIENRMATPSQKEMYTTLITR